MRELEEIEKNIIQEMIILDGNNNLNCLNNILQKQSVNFFNNQISFYIQITNSYKIEIFTHDNITEATPDTFRVFDTYLNKHILLINELMKYLLENNYILSTKYNNEQIFNMGQKIEDMEVEELSCFISDIGDDAKGKFITYSRNKYYVTKKLKELVGNNYISESEIRYQKQMKLTNTQLKYTLIGLGITTVSLCISILFNILSITNNDIDGIKITNDKLHIDIDNLEQSTINKNLNAIKDELKKQINLNIKYQYDNNSTHK